MVGDAAKTLLLGHLAERSLPANLVKRDRGECGGFYSAVCGTRYLSASCMTCILE